MRNPKNNKKAKFFCENCGTEVPPQAKICNVCGRFFASVRCPRCGKIGSVEQFKGGCPDCGYAMKEKKAKYKKNLIDSTISFFNSPVANQSAAAQVQTNGKVSSSLPVWIYVLTLFILVILVVCLYSCLKF